MLFYASLILITGNVVPAGNLDDVSGGSKLGCSGRIHEFFLFPNTFPSKVSCSYMQHYLTLLLANQLWYAASAIVIRLLKRGFAI